jgi:hypothetical protein
MEKLVLIFALAGSAMYLFDKLYVIIKRKGNELCIVLSVNSVLAAGRKRRGGGMMP